MLAFQNPQFMILEDFKTLAVQNAEFKILQDFKILTFQNPKLNIFEDEGLFCKSIVAGEKLQEKLQEAVCCQFFQGSLEILENVSSKSGLGSTWLARCENENCPSQISNDAF